MLNKNSDCAKQRELWLDIAKFFGIVFVVFNHMEVKIPVVTFLGGMFYMPVFFVAAGYTYRRKEESFQKFALAKAKRLLIPYLICNFALFVFFVLRSGFSEEALLGIFYSRNMLMRADSSWNLGLMTILNAPTWFLTCLFLCYCFYYFLDRKFEDAKKRRIAVAAAMAVGILLRYGSPVLLPWSLDNALYFLGMLEFGRFLKEKRLGMLRENSWIYVVICALFVALSYINGSVNVSIGQYGRSMVLYFVTGALGSLVCMKTAEVTEKWLPVFAKPLSFIGRHTMPILCWHLFVIEIIKKVFLILGM